MRTLTARPRHRLARALAPIVVLALVSTGAAGCSDDGDGDSGGGDDEVTTLDSDQIQESVLQQDNLGTGWEEAEVDDDDDESPGCLGEVQDIDELDPTEKVEVAFEYGEQGTPRVESGTATFEDDAALEDYFADNLETLSDCTNVETTDESGNTFTLAITSDDTVTTDRIDDQINLTAQGDITTPEGQSAPLSLHSSIYRVGPNVGVTSTLYIGDDGSEMHETYTSIAVDRLIAVVEGEEPAATTAPAPA